MNLCPCCPAKTTTRSQLKCLNTDTIDLAIFSGGGSVLANVG